MSSRRYFITGSHRKGFVRNNFPVIVLTLLIGSMIACQATWVASPTAQAVETVVPTIASPIPHLDTKPVPSAPIVSPTAASIADLPAISPPTSTPTPNPMVIDPGLLPVELANAPHYALQLKIDVENRVFSGSAVVNYTNNSASQLDQLFFRLLPNGGASYGNGAISVTAAQVDGQPVEITVSGQNTILNVPMPAPLNPGDAAQVTFSFEGRVPEDYGGPQGLGGYGIFNYTEGVMTLSAWYPMVAVFDDSGWNLDMPSNIGDSVYAEMATFDVTLDAPLDQVIASTGVTQNRVTADDRQILTISSGPAREFSLVMSPDFQVHSLDINDVRINVYVLPGDEPVGNQVFATAVESYQFYSNEFGVYPYSELDVVDAPMQYAAGVEFPGIIIIAKFLFERPGDIGLDITVSHEVAHQWWYNTVGNDVFEAPWLDEALATYSSGLFIESSDGKSVFDGVLGFWQDRYDRLVDSGRDDVVTNTLDYFESLDDPTVYSGVVYTKGALFYQALREKIGDEAFFGALAAYYAQYEFKLAKTGNLLDQFESTSGQQLDDFYQQWLYTAKP